MKINANPGDLVEISLMKKDYEGILLESPTDESGIVLLKLDSGYNIGINKKEIRDLRVIKKGEKEKEEIEFKKDAGKLNVALIMTGGTISSRLDPKTGGVDPLDTPESLFKYYPGLFETVNISKVEVPFMKPSEDMDFKDWQKIARVTEKLLNDPNIKGIILTHGTDYLHYTSAALSFFLRDLNKPVVLTYSQRSIDRASSDADLNLRCAALAAISDMAEVMIVGHGTTNDDFCYAMPGAKVRKMHTSRRDAFKTINSKPFAKIFPDKIERISDYNLRNNGKVKLDVKFEEKVVLLKVYPGQDPEILDHYMKKKYKGIVLEMSGLGHVSMRQARKSWAKKIKEIQKKGIIICAVAQTVYGRLDPMVYSNGRELVKLGIIYLGDMLAETAFVKLGWVLGHENWAKNKDLVKEKMLENFSHELNDRLEN